MPTPVQAPPGSFMERKKSHKLLARRSDPLQILLQTGSPYAMLDKLYYTILYYTILYHTILYYTMLDPERQVLVTHHEIEAKSK